MAGQTLLQLRLQNTLHLKGRSLLHFYPSRYVCKLTNESSSLKEVAVTQGGPPTLTSYIGKVDLNDRFCAHFLPSIGDGNDVLSISPRLFILWYMVRKCSDFAVELNDTGFVIKDSFIHGYLQFKMGRLRSVFEWSRSVSDL
ncbi:hypothetical protein BDM02DRAFT_3124343 [Thelephora ganbajun]|uniref:Uncharacterized protein n=1 Tax=Thelephora ganbajun TaxID=370292 RepID=A0ACB6YYX4_THEGA|nr:hypothetical protein BDM02DRAFT_3124343 [Thelephora ganbajun]